MHEVMVFSHMPCGLISSFLLNPRKIALILLAKVLFTFATSARISLLKNSRSLGPQGNRHIGSRGLGSCVVPFYTVRHQTIDLFDRFNQNSPIDILFQCWCRNKVHQERCRVEIVVHATSEQAKPGCDGARWEGGFICGKVDRFQAITIFVGSNV